MPAASSRHLYALGCAHRAELCLVSACVGYRENGVVKTHSFGPALKSARQIGDSMAERGQQQGGGRQQGGAQQQQQQQLSPAQGLARALTGIRQVQNWVELNHPQQRNVIVTLRESGDLVWGVIQGMQQQQQRQQRP
jgi:hypothetical protein